MDPLGPPPNIPIPAKPLPPILNVQMDNVVSDNNLDGEESLMDHKKVH